MADHDGVYRVKTNMPSSVEAQVRQALKQISAVSLQKLAEDLACVKFPERFSRNVLRRPGRNDEDQTTKGWPDAFVSTGTNLVDGIEATRQAASWKTHLAADLEHTSDPEYRNLSGYIFVGGYPDHSPSAVELDEWTDDFAATGIDRTKITLLIGNDLVLELCRSEYAALRQAHLGIQSSPIWFRLLGQFPLNDQNLSLFQPTQDDYESHRVASPSTIEEIVNDLLAGGCVLVRGMGAAGKTTLAELVARHPKIAPQSVWYTDLVRTTEERAGQVPSTEMTELAGPGTVFIIDNIHLDTGYAATLHDHWSRFLLPLGCKLLLMSRQTKRAEKRFGFIARQHILRAGANEMLSVVNRLAARDGLSIPTIPSAALEDWARTFGGSDLTSDPAVDLVAFTAAVDSRLKYFASGDFRLAAANSYEAVRARYLQPLGDELSNILRLASLAEYEIPLLVRQLPSPATGLSKSVNSLGLVIEEELGLEGFRHYRFVHAAIGNLLFGALDNSFDVDAERVSAIYQSPALGLRLRGSARKRSEGDSFQDYSATLESALKSADWPRRSNNFYELGNLAAYLVNKMDVLPTLVDAAIADSHHITTLFSRPFSIPAVSQFLSRSTLLGLSSCLAELDRFLAGNEVLAVMCASPASDVAAMIRLAPSSEELLSRVDPEQWRQGQANVHLESVTQSIAASRYFESLGRVDLARPIALRQIEVADPNLWAVADFDHLSHAVRLAKAPDVALEHLLEVLKNNGWFTGSLGRVRLGPLCGSLISLANYLTPALQQKLVTVDLQQRVIDEFASQRRRDETSRPVCLLGGFAALGGKLRSMPKLDWSADPRASQMLAEVAHRDTTGAVGMYELQLWLGLMVLDLADVGPSDLDQGRAVSFADRLSKSSAPTKNAALSRDALLDWLRAKLSVADRQNSAPPALGQEQP